jgi:outer membrane protein assembly factor BamA/autotransporter translocation and assembly factor TamB
MTSRLRRVGVAAAALLAAVLALAALAHSGPVRDRVLAWAAGEAWARFGVTLEADRPSYSLRTLSFAIRNVRLRAAPGAPPFLEADEINVDLPWSAARGRFSIESLHVTRPRVTIARDRDGALNLPKARPGGGGLARLPIGRLVVLHGSVTYQDVRRGLEVGATDVAIDLNPAGESTIAGSMAAQGGVRVRRPPMDLRATRFEGRASFDGVALTLESMALDSRELWGECHGRLLLFGETPRADLSYRAAVDAGLVARWWTSIGPVSGTLAVSGALAGPLANPNVQVEFAGGLAGGTVAGAGRLTAGSDRTGPAIAFLYRDLEIARVLAAANLTLPFRVAAQLDGHGELAWEDGRWLLAIDNFAEPLHASRADRRGAVALGGRSSLRVDRGAWVLTVRHTLGAAVSLSGVARGSARSDIAGRATVHAPDLAAAVRVLEAAGLDLDPLAAAGLSGEAEASLSLSGSADAPRASGSLAIDDFTVASSVPARIRASVTLDGQRLDLGDLEISGPGTTARGRAGIAFDSRALDGVLRAELSRAEDWLQFVAERWRPTASMVVDADLGGTIAAPQLDLTISGRDLAIAGQRFDRLSARARLEGPAVVVNEATFWQGPEREGLLRASGWYHVGRDTFEVQLDGASLDVRPVPAGEGKPSLPLAALADLQWTGAGSIARPAGQGHVAFRRLAWDRFDIGPARLEVSLDGQSVRASAAAPGLALTAAGTARLSAPHQFTASARISDGELGRWLAAVGPAGAVSGIVTATLEASGELERPGALEAEAALERLVASIGSGSVQLAAPARIRYAAGQLAASGVTLRSGGTTVRATGLLSTRSEDSTLSLAAEGDLQDMAPWLPELSGRPIGARGAVRAGVRITGTTRRPVVEGDLSIDAGTLSVPGAPAVTGLHLRAAVRDDALRVGELRAVWQGAAIETTADAPLVLFEPWLPKPWVEALPPGDRRAHLTAAASPITREVLAPWLPPDAAAEIDGEAAATLTLETDAFDLGHLRGELVLDRLAFSVARVFFRQEAPTRLRLADRRLSIADLRWGSATNRVQITGSLTLDGQPRIEASARGTLDLRSIGALTRAIAASGQADLDLRASGDARDPDISGRVGIVEGELRVRSPRVLISGVKGAVDLAGRRMVVRELTGTANGGALRVSGELERDGLAIGGGTLVASASGVALEWPRGLQTELGGEVTLSPTAGSIALGGAITIRRGAYREPLILTRQALAALRASQPVGPSGPAESWLDRLRLDLAIATAEPVRVDNNYGRFDLTADLRVLGTPAAPGLTGRLTMLEGGRLFVGGNAFRVDRGTIDFVDPRVVRPELTFTARARVSQYEIALSASGPPDRLTASLSSEDPSLTTSDMASLLLTGERAGESPYVTSQQVSAQVLTLLSGDLLGFMGQRVGLDAVRVERGAQDDLFGADPGLLSAETKDPGTRLSVTRRLGPQVEFVLSQNLRDNLGLTWIVVYRPGRDFEIRGVARDDGSRSVEASQQVSFGGGTAPAHRRVEREGGPPLPSEHPRISAVRFSGTPELSDAELLARLELVAGRRLDFHTWQEDRDALERFYRERGRLEARIAARSQAGADAGAIVLEYAIEAGPRTRLIVEGYELPRGLRREIEDEWADAVFDEFLLDDVREKTVAALARANYLRAEVVATIERREEGAASTKILRLRISPGEATPARTVEFSGNARIATARLQSLVRQGGLDPAAWLEPVRLESAVMTLYAHEGHLAAKVTAGPPRFIGASSILPVAITEGPAFTIGEIAIEGTRGRAVADARAAFGIQPGSPYLPARVEAGRQAVESAYRTDGYNDSQARVVRVIDRERGLVDLRLVVEEGPRQILAGVELAGVRETHRGVVTRALNAELGAPVNLDEWSRARTRLYETGVFRSADVRFEEMPQPGGEPTPRGSEHVRAVVMLEEVQPYRFRYGVQLGDRYDSTQAEDDRITTYGVVADLQRRNLFGRAIATGLAGRYEKDRWAGRVYMTAPRFFALPYRSSLYLTRAHESTRVTENFSFVYDRWTVTAEQEARWRRVLRLTWGYRWERTHLFDPDADPADPLALDITLNIARLTTALTADTRDDPFAPRRGWFSGATLEYSAPQVASDLQFFKTLLQGYYFRSAGPAVLASAARFGTITGSNAVVSELFLAGGGTTVRGYAENSLGPLGPLGESAGGRALLVLNQELRFPIVWWFQGVGFVDAGNVFAQPADLSFGDLKVGVGGGLRLDTPFALIRVDLGVPLSRPAGEPRARWYFSLGHIF